MSFISSVPDAHAYGEKNGERVSGGGLRLLSADAVSEERSPASCSYLSFASYTVPLSTSTGALLVDCPSILRLDVLGCHVRAEAPPKIRLRPVHERNCITQLKR